MLRETQKTLFRDLTSRLNLLAGDVNASIEGMHDLRWTVQCEKERSVTAVRVPAGVESYAYVIKEADRYSKITPSLHTLHENANPTLYPFVSALLLSE